MQKHGARLNVDEGLFCEDKITELEKVRLDKNFLKDLSLGRCCESESCGSILGSQKI